MPDLPRLAITPGEPAGIGPELIVTLAQSQRASSWVIVGSAALLEATAARLGLPLQLHTFDLRPGPTGDALRPGVMDGPGQLQIVDVPLVAPVTPGSLDVRNAAGVMRSLELATDACLDGIFDALVTGPVHKGVIADAGVPFSGHTEFLAQRCGCDQVLMVLTAGSLRVALATTHVPLRAVSDMITAARVGRALDLLLAGLGERYGLRAPRVLVAGLNPHAGESGHMGSEEREVLEPLLETYRQRGHDVVGPLPADTLFTPERLAGCDAVLAMYHDQGLPVLKHVGFGRAVNVTFGLPIIRTSVDHGTALDIAGRGVADSGSLREAISAAEAMCALRAQDGLTARDQVAP